jgi:hypothetical protein
VRGEVREHHPDEKEAAECVDLGLSFEPGRHERQRLQECLRDGRVAVCETEACKLLSAVQEAEWGRVWRHVSLERD